MIVCLDQWTNWFVLWLCSTMSHYAIKHPELALILFKVHTRGGLSCWNVLMTKKTNYFDNLLTTKKKGFALHFIYIGLQRCRATQQHYYWLRVPLMHMGSCATALLAHVGGQLCKCQNKSICECIHYSMTWHNCTMNIQV